MDIDQDNLRTGTARLSRVSWALCPLFSLLSIADVVRSLKVRLGLRVSTTTVIGLLQKLLGQRNTKFSNLPATACRA